MKREDKISGIYRDIMRRCYSKNNILYHNYGAKGIKVCDEWHDKKNFEDWIRKQGYFGGLRLKRYDSKGDYNPDNCYLYPSKKTAELMTEKEIKDMMELRKQKYAYMKKYNIINNHHHPLYFLHAGMLDRCYNPKSLAYKNYGGRGISVCDEWRGMLGFYHFLDWVEENGEYKKGLSIDRINYNGNYEPSNCRWATSEVQGRNKRGVIQIIVNGKLHSALSYCKEYGYSYDKFMKCIKSGMTMNQVLDEMEKT